MDKQKKAGYLEHLMMVGRKALTWYENGEMLHIYLLLVTITREYMTCELACNKQLCMN